MGYRGKSWLLGSAATVAMAWSGAASAEDAQFNIAPQPLASALNEFSIQSRQSVLFTTDLAAAKASKGVSGQVEVADALSALLAGTGLTYRRNGDTFLVVEADAPQSAGAAGDGAEVEALIVTAQKREEDIQDVPIAISAFTQEDLTRSQVAGGPDLVTQVPNFTFTKTNFSGYSIQIRGIGTQAISATTDPAVAVAFNNTPFVRNRFFEQEFYDLERVEVLRGPQGTLYGRNATAGVVNIISAKPRFRYEAKLSADVGNYSSHRLEGMVNLPLVEDKVALRLAGAWTKRDGYVTNAISNAQTDGRDLWSSRVSLRVQPTDRLDVNLVWEHFEEDDDRLRSGKQLCKADYVTQVGDIPVTVESGFANPVNDGAGEPQAQLSQGCTRESLYSADSFQTPNGWMLPYYRPLGAIGLPRALENPYVNNFQSTDLRVIESTWDPEYRAKSDLGELQVSFDLTDSLTLSSETAYNTDFVYSLQDFNRFNTAPGAWDPAPGDRPGLLEPGPNGGIFCDPQLGCSDRLVAVDISTAQSRQFSQELRLASDFTGPFNFSLGTNFLRYDTEDKYYVFFNSLTLGAVNGFFSRQTPAWIGDLAAPWVPGETDQRNCLQNGYAPGDPTQPYAIPGCVYVDPNPIGSVNDEGHNYFLSRNPYKLISYAVFGEAYYKIAENLKLTAGLRWTVDRKEAPRIPTWLLVPQSVGYPVAEVIEQEWKEPTGRLTVDWKPSLPFTDETLVYGSFAHGYKAGGANPPGYVRVYYVSGGVEVGEISTEESLTRPRTFDPEFVDAFEVGAKNTLLDGRATLNLAGFYYDYEGYQISEIVDRSAFNRNFDATVWGLEIESDWRPIDNLRLGLKAGYEKTRIADGEMAIDLMDRTAGDPNWHVLRPFPTYASSCIFPTSMFARDGGLYQLGGVGGGNMGGCELAYQLRLDPVTQQPYQPINMTNNGFSAENPYLGFNPDTAPNNGEGIAKELGGNELPNAPHWTATVTGDYSVPLPNEWLMTLHTDVHWQSQSWWRVFNDHAYDKLHPYFTMNLAAIFANEEQGWNVMAYIKNVTDETAITGAFLNSDDTGLTTNVFLTEPRLYGLRVTKAWTGSSTLFGAGHSGPYPVTVELGGQLQRHEAPYEAADPTFTGQFAPSLQIIDTVAGRDLDWGDGREATITYRPQSESWRVRGSWRRSETNRSDRTRKAEFGAGGCALNTQWCVDQPRAYFSPDNYSDVHIQANEEHEIVDFDVGYDLGIGAGHGLRSSVSLGLRFANLTSDEHLTVMGVPDWEMPAEWAAVKYSSYHLYKAELDSARKFQGTGPTLAWDGSISLLGSDEAGHLDVDLGVKGGVLFGKQKTAIAGQESAQYYTGKYYPVFNTTLPMHQLGPTEVTEINVSRTKSTSVPTVDLSLGLSYNVQRVKLSTGYRWERYFDAIDGGYEEHKSYDRTIDGPYFKIAVGFGG